MTVYKSKLKLSRQDSNLDRQNQNLQCYHYTTRQKWFKNVVQKYKKKGLYKPFFDKCLNISG